MIIGSVSNLKREQERKPEWNYRDEHGVGTSCRDAKGERRELPEIPEDKLKERNEPAWLGWVKGFPRFPGWYWVCAENVWPQVVEVVYRGGELIANDKHSRSCAGRFWTHFAGPIPEPIPPRSIDGGQTRGNRHVK